MLASYYMLDIFRYLLCLKLYFHNSPVPICYSASIFKEPILYIGYNMVSYNYFHRGGVCVSVYLYAPEAINN